MAAYWDKNANEAGIFLDGFLVSHQDLVNGSYIRANDHGGVRYRTEKGHLADF